MNKYKYAGIYATEQRLKIAHAIFQVCRQSSVVLQLWRGKEGAQVWLEEKRLISFFVAVGNALFP